MRRQESTQHWGDKCGELLGETFSEAPAICPTKWYETGRCMYRRAVGGTFLRTVSEGESHSRQKTAEPGTQSFLEMEGIYLQNALVDPC